MASPVDRLNHFDRVGGRGDVVNARICTALWVSAMASGRERAGDALERRLASNAANKALAGNAETNRPAKLLKAGQIRQELQIVALGLAETNAGIDDQLVER